MTQILVEDILQQGDSIINLPYRYRSSADPGGRVFVRHMMMDAPLISIRPGRARFRGKRELRDAFKVLLGVDSDDEVEALVSGGIEAVESVFSSRREFGDDNDKGFFDEIKEEIRKKRFGAVAADIMLREGVRYVEFEPSINEYVSTVLTMASRVHASLSQLSAPVAFTAGQAREAASKSSRGGFFTFWADNSTSVSESANSEYGSFILEGLFEKGVGLAREAKNFLGLTGAGGILDSTVDAVAEFISASDSGIRTSIAAGIRGHKPSFPNSWKNSSFSRSYSLSFKLYSPYGSPEAIFRNVYLPFIMLLSMALPMSRSPGSFSEPFLFQIDAPGYLACDLGICTSLTFTKGGSEGLWSSDGLPRMIDVTMAVDDLYPALTASHNVGSLKINIGLMTFLDNMSGINLSLAGERQTVYGAIKERMNQVSTIGAPTAQAAIAYTQDFYYDFNASRLLGNLFGLGTDAS